LLTGRTIREEVVVRRGRPAAAGAWDVLTSPDVPRSDWSINQMLAIELAAYLDRVQPPRILEAGSGYSTAILAAYAAHHDAKVVTLEHDLQYLRATRRGLRRLGLDRQVDLRLAPLRQHWFEGRGPYRWYDVPLEGQFDFVFIDGPPKVLGRRAAFFALQGHLRPGWQVWIDDGFRQHESHSVKVWERGFSGVFDRTRRDLDGKGVFVLSDARGERRLVAQSHLGIAVLGHGDPNWWARAEQNLDSRLLESSHVVVVDRDETPGRTLPRAAGRFVNEQLPAAGSLRQRRWAMFGSLARRREVQYVLYLDDQWSPSTLDLSWLSRAVDILRVHDEVEQVSLRHLVDIGAAGTEERQPIWMSFNGEPGLLRADWLRTLAQTESAGRRRPPPEPSPLRTVQLSPGVFRMNDRAGYLAESESPDRLDEEGEPLAGLLTRTARSLMAAVLVRSERPSRRTIRAQHGKSLEKASST
jgi:Methyltransferase domain